MRILFLTNKSAFHRGVFGGAESSIWLLAKHLARSGHTVHYVTKDRAGTLSSRIVAGTNGGLQTHVFRTFFLYRRSRLIRIMNDRLLEAYLRRLISDGNIQIAYCFYELENVHLLTRLAKSFNQLRIIMRMAGFDWYEQCLRRPRLIASYSAIFNQIDSVNYISQGLRQLVYQRLNELKMKVNFNHEFTIDIGSSVAPGRRVPYGELPTVPFRMVMATRFSRHQKRQDLLVEALGLVEKSLEIEMVFFGEGPRRLEVQRLAHGLGLSDRVRFRSFVPQHELWKELEKANLLCHATDHEGLGKIVIESAAIGLPVLASNAPTLNSLLQDGENGFLVENTAVEWADRIEELAKDHALRNRVSTQSMLWARRHFNPELNMAVYEQTFRDVLTEETL